MSFFVLILLYLSFVLIVLKKIRPADLLYLLIVYPIVISGLIRYNEFIIPIHIYSTAIIFLPSYCIFRFLPIRNVLFGLVSAAYFNFFLSIFDFVIISRQSDYDMGFGYEIAIAGSIIFYNFVNKRRIIDIILSAISIYYVFIFGNRGALLLELLTIMYIALFSFVHKNTFRIISLVFIYLLSVYFHNSDQLADTLSMFFQDNRNLKKIEQGTFFVSKPRDSLYNEAKHIIQMDHDLGAFSSRKYIVYDPYPHSILYEFQIDYGKYFGFLLFLFTIAACITNHYFAIFIDSDYLLPAAIYSLFGISSLLVSSSFYLNSILPAIIAFFVIASSRIHFLKRTE